MATETITRGSMSGAEAHTLIAMCGLNTGLLPWNVREESKKTTYIKQPQQDTDNHTGRRWRQPSYG